MVSRKLQRYALCLVTFCCIALVEEVAALIPPKSNLASSSDQNHGQRWIGEDWKATLDPLARLYPPEYEGHLGELMVSHEEIRSRIRELAELIHKDYEGSRPVMLCTLKGACPFYQHLLDAMQDLKHGYSMEFLRASSYAGTSTTGDVKLVGKELVKKDFENRHVILIEDIVDTGTTISNLLPMLESLGPKSVQVCTLLEKRLGNGHKPAAKAKYSGFSIPDKFIIGYGLDYNELYRDLKDIWVISQAGIDFDSNSLL